MKKIFFALRLNLIAILVKKMFDRNRHLNQGNVLIEIRVIVKEMCYETLEYIYRDRCCNNEIKVLKIRRVKGTFKFYL